MNTHRRMKRHVIPTTFPTPHLFAYRLQHGLVKRHYSDYLYMGFNLKPKEEATTNEPQKP